MKKTFSAQFVISIAVVAAVAGAIALYWWHSFDASDDEDRSVIIVRNGSVDFDLKTKDWDLTDKKNARPDHPKGGHVIGFMVTFDPADAGVANSGCPTLPVVGSSVAIDFKAENGTNELVTINAVLNGDKNEPVVTAPADMTLSANKKVLSHGTAKKGSIVSVTVKYGNLTQKCAPSTGFAKEIKVKPLR